MNSSPRVYQGFCVPLLFCGALLGAFIGGATDAVNGLIYAPYFEQVPLMFDPQLLGLYPAIVGQGLGEGAFNGVIGGLVYALVLRRKCRKTGGAVTLRQAVRGLWPVPTAAFSLWLAGLGLGTASYILLPIINPSGPSNPTPLLFYTVGGGIEGTYLGGFLGVAFACLLFRLPQDDQAPRGFAPPIPEAK